MLLRYLLFVVVRMRHYYIYRELFLKMSAEVYSQKKLTTTRRRVNILFILFSLELNLLVGAERD